MGMETMRILIGYAMSCLTVPIFTPFRVNLMYLFMCQASISVPPTRVRVQQSER